MLTDVFIERRLIKPALVQAWGQETKVVKLTKRETRVLLLAVKDLTVKQIGHEMRIAEKTVWCFRAKVFKKLGVHTVVGLCKTVLKHNIITLEDFLSDA